MSSTILVSKASRFSGPVEIELIAVLLLLDALQDFVYDNLTISRWASISSMWKIPTSFGK